jgi:sugar transferase (PEP-CTERM/EpsH1 system associated)
MESSNQLSNTEQKIRIAHVVDEVTPAGKETGIVKLLNHLTPQRFESYIFALKGTRSFGIMDIENLNIIALNKKNGNDWRIPLKLYKLLKRYHIDIVHTHSWGTLVEGIFGAKLAGIPIIIHGEHGSFPLRWHQRQAQRLLWRLPYTVLSVSNDLKRRLSGTIPFPEKRIRVIPNGVKEEQFFPSGALRKEFRSTFNFAKDDFVVGTVGRFSEVKNQQMLIRAAAALIQRGEKIQVVLVSKGRMEGFLKELSGLLGVKKNIHFLGFQSHINMILNGFDIFVLTSLSEGCSNVIQEAMFCQKAIIATNVGGNPELIEDFYSGLLVESSNHVQLAEKILYLKNNAGLRVKLGKKAREKAMQHFTLTKMVQEYENLYIEAFYKRRSGTL